MSTWIPYEQLPWNDTSIKTYHIDTRNFAGTTDTIEPTFVNLHKTRKRPDNYFHTVEEILELLHRYKRESGGPCKWRMFSLSGEAAFRTSNWQLKYIRIYRTDKGLVIYDCRENFLFGKHMLSEPVEQKYLNAH